MLKGNEMKKLSTELLQAIILATIIASPMVLYFAFVMKP